MEAFKLTKKREKKKKKEDSFWDWPDFLFICSDLLVLPLRLVWFILRMFGRLLEAIFEGIIEFFSF